MRALKSASLVFAAWVAGAAAPVSAATQFDFQFDNAGFVNDEGMLIHDGPLDQPIVGTGTFTSPTDLAAGTYDLTSLSGFTVTFSFANGDTFTTSDILTPLSGVAVTVTDLGGGVQRLFFTESGGPGSDGGPNSGSLDLNNGPSFLTFSPSSFGNFLGHLPTELRSRARTTIRLRLQNLMTADGIVHHGQRLVATAIRK